MYGNNFTPINVPDNLYVMSRRAKPSAPFRSFNNNTETIKKSLNLAAAANFFNIRPGSSKRTPIIMRYHCLLLIVRGYRSVFPVHLPILYNNKFV